jgi:hypothetical protein
MENDIEAIVPYIATNTFKTALITLAAASIIFFAWYGTIKTVNFAADVVEFMSWAYGGQILPEGSILNILDHWDGQ